MIQESFMTKIIRFVKKNVVFCVAAFAALATMFFVPPDAEYLSYFDWRTLACLFLPLRLFAPLET